MVTSKTGLFHIRSTRRVPFDFYLESPAASVISRNVIHSRTCLRIKICLEKFLSQIGLNGNINPEYDILMIVGNIMWYIIRGCHVTQINILFCNCYRPSRVTFFWNYHFCARFWAKNLFFFCCIFWFFALFIASLLCDFNTLANDFLHRYFRRAVPASRCKRYSWLRWISACYLYWWGLWWTTTICSRSRLWTSVSFQQPLVVLVSTTYKLYDMVCFSFLYGRWFLFWILFSVLFL